MPFDIIEDNDDCVKFFYQKTNSPFGVENIVKVIMNYKWNNEQ